MKKRLLVILLIFTGIESAVSQTVAPDTSWKTGGFVSINFSQASLSYWAPGGENSIAVAGALNLFANYAKDKTEWANSIDLAYAMIKSGEDKLRKNDDKLEVNSKYSHKLSEKWLYSLLANFKSQFAPGYKFPDD